MPHTILYHSPRNKPHHGLSDTYSGQTPNLQEV